jgi:hypothetical protein
MILLEENFEDVQASVSEDKKKTYLFGVFAEAETKNRNGRVYDLKEMTREVQRINDLAKANRHVLGQLDHPVPQTLDISLKEVSHRIVEMRMDGNKALGKAEILESHPNGQILKGLVTSGVNVGVSTRASGQLDESTGRVSKFSLKTVDAVATPSCQSAYPETIQEQLQLYRRGHIINDLSEAVIHDPIAQKYFQIELKRFVETVLSKYNK